MKFQTVASVLLCLGLTTARPLALQKREVPQEHSHQQFITTVTTSLQKNNPAGIVDPIFGLLGDAAAAEGKGQIQDVECLQQATADQAFTNSKAANDVTGMTAALIYRALERNTGKVGLASNSCTSLTAVNPEIAAISQHQDPASPGAAATNKAIVLELAKQIAGIGGDPQDALKSGTFAPGSTSDLTGKGNTCDTANDATGCIFTENLLVEDATPAEVAAAAGGAAATNGTAAAAPAAGAAANGTSSAAAPAVTSSAAASATEEESSECSVVVDEGDDVGLEDPPTSTSTTSAAAVAASTPAAAASSSSVPTFSNGTASATSGSSSSSSSSSLDLGSCTNPTIIFANGLDGRTNPAFEPANQQDFPHGSANAIGVITTFLCQQLDQKCKASATTNAACAKGSTAASTLTGQAAANAFNAVFQ